MNTQLLRKVAKHILAEPKRLYMRWYVIRKQTEYDTIDGREFAKCGTAACIAGWTLLLSGKDPAAGGAHRTAIELLDIDYESGNRLFEPSEWPAQFKRGIRDDGKLSTAKVAVKRIEHFIKTKGAE